MLATSTNQYQPIDAEQIIEDLFADTSLDPSWFDMDPAVFYSMGDNSCGFIPKAPSIIDEVDRNDVMQSVETNTLSPISQMGSYSDTYVNA